MNNSFRILSIEAKDLYGAMNQVHPYEQGYSIRNKDGVIGTKKFSAVFDWSLDSIKLQEVYEKRVRRKDFSFSVGQYNYTKNIICVTFKYSYKEFNLAGKGTFVKAGYSFRDCVFNDCIALDENGNLIGVQTNGKVIHPVDSEILGKHFKFVEDHYEQDKDFKTLVDKAGLRNYLYVNGFRCDGVDFVRYKRSCGSSRVGKCLFVNKVVAKDMEKWDKCGLKIKEGDPIDLAGYEAYISLPMSSIVDTVDIPLDSILVIDDYDSVFRDDVVAVEIKDNHLFSSNKNVEIKNTIWDGQSLLDKSLMGKYSDKGMILLRNRFFKSCCFNTNIQQFFKDNNVSSIDQLNGFTFATDISQVKMITTPSSIKFVKFGKLEDWLRTVSSTFGLVKYEKPPHPFGGKMVQAHYQLFNTLHLSFDEMKRVLQPSLKYLSAIRSDPAVLRYEIKYPLEVDDLDEPLQTKNDIIYRMTGINDKFVNTKLYYAFRDDLVRGELRNMKQGHVLVNGNYSTMMGNGLEMLKHSIGMFDGTSAIEKDCVHSRRFDYGKDILCSRSPHVTVGNIMVVKNVDCEEYNTYFNLTKEIVCVNSINSNMMERLNGCDFDSDTILMTDDEFLVEVAKRHYYDFKVPTNLTSAKKTQRYYTREDRADLDLKTSVNKIGEIINLSQQLNSLMWDRINKGDSIESCNELYNDICKLAVLSNVEIDRAKREYVLNSLTEINLLKEKYKLKDEEKTVKPRFFKTICTENGYKLSDSIKYKEFNTSMDYLQKILSSYSFNETRVNKRIIKPFMSMIKEPPAFTKQGFYYNAKDKVVNIIRTAKDNTKKLFYGYEFASYEDKQIVKAQAADINQDCIESITKICESPSTMYMTLRELDNDKNSDVMRYMFNVLFGKQNSTFYNMIKESKEEIYTLEEDPDGDIEFYGIHFKKIKLIN